MEFLTDTVFLSRLQFALTASYHFIFVPISIGLGLIMAIFVTKAYRSKTREADALARFWIKIYVASFAIGVATGITMEFSFGTNWANYSRFVGDIFGAPLAAEALSAFFLESIFMGILIFGKNKVPPKFYMISSWLTFFGSALSALWIIIANSWMQTPGGAELSNNGSKAIITDFFAAAFNPSTISRYCHTVLALLVMGSFIAIAVAGYYLLKKTHVKDAKDILSIGSKCALIATVALLVSAHASAVNVWNEQPTKMAMMEGQYERGSSELSLFGWVDEKNQTTHSLGIPGGTSFLATGSPASVYPGLKDLTEGGEYSEVNIKDLPVNLVYQTYHIMVACFGVICLVLLLVFIFNRRQAKKSIDCKKWLLKVLTICPLFPMLAVQCGWWTAEFGRQPYVVYPATSSPNGVSLLTSEGVSVSPQPFEILITVVLFVLVYAILFYGWVRVIGKTIKQGPIIEEKGE